MYSDSDQYERDMNDSMIGTEVAGCRIEEVIGRGGMGVVYKAEQVALERPVALKRINTQLADDKSFLQRFRSEARALARIDSPYIVEIHTLQQTEYGLVIVMEYVEGGTLKQRIEPEGMRWQESLPLIHQMLTALEHAHGAGVIHRDLKPHNILLTDIVLAHGTRVKMTDFGLAKVNTSGDPTRTVTRSVYGSLNYMSPEQVKGNGQVDHRSDIYSVGMTIYEMMAGRLPFEDGSTEYTIMRTIVEKDLPLLRSFAPDLPRPLINIVEKAIRKDPARRFQSASEMQTAIEDFNDSRSHDRVVLPPSDDAAASSESGNGLAGPAMTPKSKVGTLAAMAALLVAVLVGGYFFAPSVAGLFAGGDDTAPADASAEVAGPSQPRAETQAPATSSAQPPSVPASIASLSGVRGADALRQALRRGVQNGEIRFEANANQIASPEQSYVFVLDRRSGQVQAVLGPGGEESRFNLRTDEPVQGWQEQYAEALKFWVLPVDA